LVLLLANIFFEVITLLGGTVGLVATSDWVHFGMTMNGMQEFALWLFCISLLLLFLNWWIGAGRKLDKIFRDYLFDRPFLIGDNMPFSEFSSSTIVRLNFVRALAYYSLLVPSSKKLPFNSWADKFEYKSQLTVFDKVLVWVMDIVFIIGFVLFGISLL